MSLRSVISASPPGTAVYMWLIWKPERSLINTYVAHGRRSGGEYAKSFSNKWSSHKSSLGFYVTEMTYTGKHGYAMKDPRTGKRI